MLQELKKVWMTRPRPWSPVHPEWTKPMLRELKKKVWTKRLCL